MSDESDTPIEPSPDPSPDESPFEIQPLDAQDKGDDRPRVTRDGD